MKEKNSTLKKLITGLLFFASLFLAAAVLVFSKGESNYIIPVALAGVVMLAAGYFFLSALFEEKEELWRNLYDEMEKNAQSGYEYDEIKGYMESMDRTQKAMFSVLKRQEATTEEKIERLEAAIDHLTEQQSEDQRTLIKYNKENARQIAMNQQESVELATQKIIAQLQDGTYTQKELSEEFDEFELENLLNEEVAEEQETEELWIEEPETEEVVTEETTTEEPEESSTDSLGAVTGVDLSDPNAALSPEDIAKLFAAAGN